MQENRDTTRIPYTAAERTAFRQPPVSHAQNTPLTQAAGWDDYTPIRGGQAALLAPEGSVLNQIRVVPNPLYFGGSNDRNGGFVRFPDFQDKISFRGLPGACRIDIYTELGEQLATLENTSGSGSVDWNLATKFGQPVVSGVYVAVITATRDYDGDQPGRDGTFRNGDQVIRKFVIIR